MDKPLSHLKQKDDKLSKLITTYAVPSFKRHTNYYHELVDSIISQQLSVKAAATIAGRFKDLFGGNYPSPEEILQNDIEELRSVGLSRPKAGYIQDLARHVLDGTVKFDELDKLSNQEIIDELTKVKGIGEWTVHMFLMFCMGRLDVLAYGDLGIRNGLTKLYELDHTATPDDVKHIAKKNNWHPYESVACWYIWQSLDNTPTTL
ncbi:TPA: DNA-3-methyladenine glycosylase 2 family protein [Candidatus Saccharibacteria bacterium]|nr:DNA-3-methyladenine glycosylase 2 family protein [Candidatus Saccharibacteria bacterium]HRJ90897.1 DNA-3-methyladenine glycosylase [Candidatus Saccharibacteria bacterium]